MGRCVEDPCRSRGDLCRRPGVYSRLLVPPPTPSIAWGLTRPSEVLVQEVWAEVWDPVPMCVQVPVAVGGSSVLFCLTS